MKKRILGLGIVAAVVISLVASGTWAVFTDTETTTDNVFTAGTIDISLNPTEGQDVVTVEGDLDLKPCQVGYTRIIVTNDGTNPADIWKHIANVRNDENGVVDAEDKFYTGTPVSRNWLLSDWIHYDMSVGEALKSTYNTDGKVVEADIVKTSACCTTTWVVDITSENAPHGVYGIGLAISGDGVTPSSQVWYAEQTTNLPAPYTNTAPDWYYQPYGTGWDGTVQPVSEIPWIQVNERTGEPFTGEKHFEISIDCANLGGPGATYYWAMQLRTNLKTWLGVYDWGADASGFLENQVPSAAVEEIAETEGFFLTLKGPHLPTEPTPAGEVECSWMYLGVLEPGESMAVCQSYHLDIDVGNWGQSDQVKFDMEFMAQQTVGDPASPTPELIGHGKS